LTVNNEFIEQEISSLFKDSRDKLDRIDEDVNKSKTEVVIKLAKDLEGRIPMDTISSTILEKFKGRIGKSLIHKYLPAKYKQEHRRKNVLKQKKNIIKDSKLALLSALNPLKDKEMKEEEKQMNKDLIAIDVDGRTYIQRDNDVESSKTSDETSILTDKSLTQPFYQLQKEQEQPVEKPSQFENIMAGRIVIEESGASVESSYDNSKDVLPFEFPIGRRDIQSRLN